MTPWKKCNIITYISMAIIALLLVLAATGCAPNKPKSEVVEDGPSMFTTVERGPSYAIVYHNDTKVMYAISNGSYNYGTFTLLVDSDGAPMLWGK